MPKRTNPEKFQLRERDRIRKELSKQEQQSIMSSVKKYPGQKLLLLAKRPSMEKPAFCVIGIVPHKVRTIKNEYPRDKGLATTKNNYQLPILGAFKWTETDGFLKHDNPVFLHHPEGEPVSWRLLDIALTSLPDDTKAELGDSTPWPQVSLHIGDKAFENFLKDSGEEIIVRDLKKFFNITN